MKLKFLYFFLSSPSTVQLEMMRTWWERFSSESAAFTAWASEREKELEAVSAMSSLEPLDKHIRTVEVRTARTPVSQENSESAESARYFHKVFLLFRVSPFFIRSKCLKVAVRASISLARGLWRLRENKMAF